MPALLFTWEVTAPGSPPVLITAANWLIALGEALHPSGALEGPSRLAFDRLSDGTVLAHDFGNNRRYTVRRAAAAQENRPQPGFQADLHA